jgi:Mn2+/Fe2+ NRAMP family transporter
VHFSVAVVVVVVLMRTKGQGFSLFERSKMGLVVVVVVMRRLAVNQSAASQLMRERCFLLPHMPPDEWIQK